MTLGSFPVDPPALRAVRAGLDSYYTVQEDGTHELIGEFSLHQVLQFYSGYDETRSVLIQEADPTREGWAGAAIYEHLDPVYSEHDLVRALVDEIERLREKYEHDSGTE